MFRSRTGLVILTLAAGLAAAFIGSSDELAVAATSSGGGATSRYSAEAEQRARQFFEGSRTLGIHRLVRGDRSRKEVALTFDDGPHGGATVQLLDLLKRENVRATFFVVGRMADVYPELLQREAAEGHEVANHTYDHLRLSPLNQGQVEMELREGAQAIERAVGSPTRFFRPPGGEYDAQVLAAARKLGQVMVLWTDDPGDFSHPAPSVIEERILREVTSGSIVLLHDGIQQTIDMLPSLIAKLRQRGYKFVTVSEMAHEPGAISSGGPVVGSRRGAAANMLIQVTTPPATAGGSAQPAAKPAVRAADKPAM